MRNRILAIVCSLFTAILIVTTTTAARADVKLAGIFGDHMVLQQNVKVPIWGWASPGERVDIKVTGGDVHISADTTAGDDGRWRVELPPMKASTTPIELMITGKNTFSINDVLVGEVWICSGQSNMEFSLKASEGGRDEIAKGDHPLIRLCIIGNRPAPKPLPDREAEWALCSPDTCGKFTAVGYYFGRNLQPMLGVPVGLIESAVAGTKAEAWTNLEALQSSPILANYVDAFHQAEQNLAAATQPAESTAAPAPAPADTDADAKPAKRGKKSGDDGSESTGSDSSKPFEFNGDVPTSLYNGMIAPLVPFAIKGVVWYQGESNADKADEYRTLFPALITGWRQKWGEGDFPFLFVQLPGLGHRAADPEKSDWAMLREAQTQTLALPATGMAVTIDLSTPRMLLHPKNKTDVGKRLALVAEHLAYGQDVKCQGPTYDSMQVEGDKVRIHFKNTEGGLIVKAAAPKDGDTTTAPAAEMKGFTIAGDDGKFVWADASIDGDSVLVSSDQVKSPVSVRYGWAQNPEVNLCNKAGLPAGPFRTDHLTE